MQIPLFQPDAMWRPPELTELPRWNEAKRIAIDCETCDPMIKQLGTGVRRGGYIAGISFAIEDGPSFYLPIRHKGGDNLPVEGVLGYVREQAASFEGILVGANLPYDLQYLKAEAINFPRVKFFRDIQIADPLIYELHDSFSLQNIALRHGLEGKDEALLRQAALEYGVDPKAGMHLLAARFVGRYAEVDCEQPLKILRKQEKLIDELNLWEIYDLESQVLPVLIRMTERGVRIDMDHLRKVEEWSIAEERNALDLVKRETGVDIGLGNVYAAKALAPALEALGVKLHKTAKGLPNIDKVVLSSINHPVASALQQARKVNKLRTTFAASIRSHQVNGRIHCTFNQIAREDDGGDQKGARYGRLSATNPNLQQQPSRDEFASFWRKIYIPEEGTIWYSNDYSQQEPRWTTHFAAVMNLPKAREAAQAYWDDPKLDNHDFMTRLVYGDETVANMDKDTFKRSRSRCKNIYLGLCYGEGGAKLCRDIGVPTRWSLRLRSEKRVLFYDTQEEALKARQDAREGYVWETAGEEGQSVLDQFDERAPFIRQLAKAAGEKAQSVGYVRTILKRVLHFPQKADGTFDWTHKALNRVIQGSSADQMKKALVLADAEGLYLQIQVHDEANGSGTVEDAKKLSYIMRTCIPGTKVPFRVDVEIGQSWGELKDLDYA